MYFMLKDDVTDEYMATEMKQNSSLTLIQSLKLLSHSPVPFSRRFPHTHAIPNQVKCQI